MPPRNNPLPSAVRLFNCTICDKGYPRQLDYENHLRSYDHNHRQRLADMKKLTASNDPESSKPKQGLDMRSINVEEANRKMGSGGGGRFTKIGGGGAAGAGIVGRGFKKVGVSVGKEGEKKDVLGEKKAEEKKAEEKKAEEKKAEEKKAEEKKVEEKNVEEKKVEEKKVEEKAAVVAEAKVEEKKEVVEDTVMAGADDEEEEVTWEQYDFTKPTVCDHASCAGCKTDGIWSGEWVAV